MKVYALVIVAVVLTGCGSPDTGTGSSNSPVETCVAKGVAYFKEIEAFPTLSDGRDAETVARERCHRTTGAFDGLS